MRIDAHQHFWRPSRGDYGWLTPEAHPAICRKLLPQDLAPLLEDAGIQRTVLVQAAPTVGETEYLLGLAAEASFVAGVVGWADLEAADAAAAIERLARNPQLLGLRPMLQDLEDDAWILRPTLARAVDAMQAAGLRLDALVTPRHLRHLSPRFLAARPDLEGGDRPWRQAGYRRRRPGWLGRAHASQIAEGYTCACCKLSGLVTRGR